MARTFFLTGVLVVLAAGLAQGAFNLQQTLDPPGHKDSRAAWGDYDNDGDLDLIVMGDDCQPGDRYVNLFRNAAGILVDVSGTDLVNMYGTNKGWLAWGDFDNDGDIDLAMAGSSDDLLHGDRIKLYRNVGGVLSYYQRVDDTLQLSEVGIAWGDCDNDGDLDLAIAGGTAVGVARIYINQNPEIVGDLFFSSDNYILLGQRAHGAVAWGDYNNDGKLDIVVAGTGGWTIFRNDGDNMFAPIATGTEETPDGSVCWGDYDNDGDLDIAVVGGGLTRLIENGGSDTFVVSNPGFPDLNNADIAWGDQNLDGNLDLALLGEAGSYHTRVADGNGSGGFSTSWSPATQLARGAVAWGDYDGDGDLDLLIAGLDVGGSVTHTELYRNETAVSNIPPGVPTGLTASPDKVDVTLNWNGVADSNGGPITYNVRVGTTPGGCDVVSPMSIWDPGETNDARRLVAAMGNVQFNTSWKLENLDTAGDYYWSVQAVDAAFEGGDWSFEGSFTISTSVRVTSPNGGEIWNVGDDVLITWDQTSDIIRVEIEISTNGGSTWETITSSTLGDGEYAWTVGSGGIDLNASTSCRIKITDADDANVNANSDANFTIVSVELTSPVGGEGWDEKTTHDITWTAAGVSTLDILLSGDTNGQYWEVLADDVGASSGTFSWTITVQPGTFYRVRLADSLPVVLQDRLGVDTIAVWALTSGVSISILDGTNDPDNEFRIIVSCRGKVVEDFDNLSMEDVVPGYVETQLHDPDSGSSYIAVMDLDNSSLAPDNRPAVQSGVGISPRAWDTTANPFTVAGISLITPNGGESWTANGNWTMSWSSAGIDFVTIELSRDAGSTWTVIDQAGGNEYIWYAEIFEVLKDRGSTPQPTLKVQALKQGVSVDITDGTTDPANQFCITVYQGATPVETFDDLTMLTVEAIINDITGSSYIEVTNLGSTSSAPQNRPAVQTGVNITASTVGWLARISDQVDGMPWDVSDEEFYIFWPGTKEIVVTAPNGDETWVDGQSAVVRWASNAVALVDIYISRNGGSSFNSLITGVDAGLFNWTWDPVVRGATNPGSCLIEVREQAGTTADRSDAGFSISNVRVSVPNGGESWSTGATQNITWSGGGITAMEIQISRDGNWTDGDGSDVETLASDVTPSPASYSWAPVTGPPSEHCLMRMVDSSNAVVLDVSNNEFTINGTQVVSPNGGGKWTIDKSYTILWTSIGVANVRIKLSRDNGVSWVEISGGSVPASDESFVWKVSGSESKSCRIRVEDAANANVYDDSDGTFAIAKKSAKPDCGCLMDVTDDAGKGAALTFVVFVMTVLALVRRRAWARR